MSESYNEPTTTKGNPKSYTANSKAPSGSVTNEPTGPITIDSLANESINTSGAFSQNANPSVLGVKGANSTLTNEETSTARRLNPAEDAESRDGSRFTSTQYEPNTSSTDDTPRGVYNTQRNVSDEGAAPTYTDTVVGNLHAQKPKGDNLVENQGIPPNRSTYTGDVGGSKDPGRLAEQEFANKNAGAGADVGYAKDTSVNDSSRFEGLDPSEDA